MVFNYHFFFFVFFVFSFFRFSPLLSLTLISLVIDTGIQKNNTARLVVGIFLKYIMYIYIYIYIYMYIYKRGSRTVIRINFALARIRSVSGIEFLTIAIQDLACNDPLAKRTTFSERNSSEFFTSWRWRKFLLFACEILKFSIRFSLFRERLKLADLPCSRGSVHLFPPRRDIHILFPISFDSFFRMSTRLFGNFAVSPRTSIILFHAVAHFGRRY